MVVFKVVFVCF